METALEGSQKKFSIPRGPFHRLVRDFLQQGTSENFQIQIDWKASDTLREAIEKLIQESPVSTFSSLFILLFLNFLPGFWLTNLVSLTHLFVFHEKQAKIMDKLHTLSGGIGWVLRIMVMLVD